MVSSAATREVAFLVFALGIACLAVIAQRTGFFQRAVLWLRKDPLVRVLLVAVLLGAGPITSRSKNGTPSRFAQTTQPADIISPFVCNEASTNGVTMVEPTTNAVVSQTCLLHGASEAGEWMESAKPFFRWGTNDIRRLYASPGCLSFGSKRHPYLGDSIPNGTPEESLVVLRTPLGIVPEANWHLIEWTGVVSRFWHDALPGGGRVFTWENALLDRLPDRPATIQAELRPNGDFIYRYDFSASGPPGGRPLPVNYTVATPGVVPASGHNPVLIGAQRGPAAVEAFRLVGTETNAATVFRLDGNVATNGASIADLLAIAPLLELRWKNVADLGDLAGDTDGDGLTDWAEVFLYGTDPHYADTDGDGTTDGSEVAWGDDPLDADEDGDGVPDGTSEEDWLANPLWAANSKEGGNVAITLYESIPDGASATFVLGDLAIPLHGTNTFEFCLPEGVTVEGRLFSRGVDVVRLSISPQNESDVLPPLRRGASIGIPRLRDDPKGVLDGNSSEGTFRIAIPDVIICNIDGTRAESECVHTSDGSREYIVRFEPDDWGLTLDDCVVDGFERVGDDRLRLTVGGNAYDEAIGRVSLWKYLDYDIVEASVLLWRCGMPADEPYPVVLAVDVGVSTTNSFKGILPRHSMNPPGRPTMPCRLRITGWTEHDPTFHISGPKLKFGPDAQDSITATLSGTNIYDFVISGEIASEAMKDALIYVRRDGPTGPICATGAVTVVWVDPITIRCGQGDPFSPDNASPVKPQPPYLGLHGVSFSGNFRTTLGHVVEIKGEVHPKVFMEDFEFKRIVVDQVAAIVSTNGSVSYLANNVQIASNAPAAIDPMWSKLQDVFPFPLGNIFDVDVPGVSYADFYRQPGGTKVFTRYNFIQYVCVNGIRCSNDFLWHANLAAKRGSATTPNGVFTATRPGHPDDNSVGSGHTSPVLWQTP